MPARPICPKCNSERQSVLANTPLENAAFRIISLPATHYHGPPLKQVSLPYGHAQKVGHCAAFVGISKKFLEQAYPKLARIVVVARCSNGLGTCFASKSIGGMKQKLMDMESRHGM